MVFTEVTTSSTATAINHEGEKVRREFLEVLARNKTPVPLERIPGVRRDFTEEIFSDQDCLQFPPAIGSCTSGEVANSEPDLQEENFFVITEEGEQGRVPVLLVKPVGEDVKRPVVVFLHSTNRMKECFRPYMKAFAARGYIAVAIDCRYHGERAPHVDSYNEALISAWRNGDKMPFIFDTVWDLVKVVDYLCERQDVDSARIGVLGISLGGMHAWFAAVADPRISVVVPIIGVQNFNWAVANEAWHARVQSIPHAFEVAKEDLGKQAVDSETVSAVWHRIAPGLIDKFDAEHTIHTIAPRPLLVINGERDPRCPVKGLEEVLKKVTSVYQLAGVPENFTFKSVEGIDHAFCESMGHDASVWMDHHLKPNKPLRYVLKNENLVVAGSIVVLSGTSSREIFDKYHCWSHLIDRVFLSFIPLLGITFPRTTWIRKLYDVIFALLQWKQKSPRIREIYSTTCAFLRRSFTKGGKRDSLTKS